MWHTQDEVGVICLFSGKKNVFPAFQGKNRAQTPYTIKVHEYTTYLVYSLVGKVSKQIKIVTGQILL